MDAFTLFILDIARKKKKQWYKIFNLLNNYIAIFMQNYAYEKTKHRTTYKLFDYLLTYTIKAGKIAITKNSNIYECT